MRFCQDHWDALRVAVSTRGLDALIPETGEQAARALQREIETGEATVDSFDPLMFSMMLITANAGDAIRSVGGNPLAMMAEDAPAHVACPICFLNWLSVEHDRICTRPDCEKPKGLTFDDWIDRGADAAVERWKMIGGATDGTD